MLETLPGVRVLLVDADSTASARVRLCLAEQGAHVRGAGDADEARRVASSFRPEVVIVDVSAVEQGWETLFDELRGPLASRAGPFVPGVALTANEAEAARAIAEGSPFVKYVMKPVRLRDLVDAVASVVYAASATAHERDGGGLTERVVELARRNDMRGVLQLVNARTRYRYSSIFRFEDQRLVSVWTFDRESPERDPFPAGLPIDASYCVFVRDAGAPFVMSDSQRDPRVLHHRKRDSVRAYCGVPLLCEDGTMVGSLCHFDVQAQPVDGDTVDALVQVARALASHFVECGGEGA